MLRRGPPTPGPALAPVPSLPLQPGTRRWPRGGLQRQKPLPVAVSRMEPLGPSPKTLNPFLFHLFFFLNNLGEKNLSEILGMEWGGRFRGNMSYGWEVDENVSDFPPS